MKKLFLLFALILILLVSGSCAKQALRIKNVVIYENKGSTEDLVLENEYLRLRFFPRTAEFTLTEKSNGVTWRSNPQNSGSDPLADTVTSYLLSSQFSLEYADVTGVGMALYSGSQSVEKGAYNYEITDNVLKVSYTIGNMSRTYLIPPAVTEERMLSFLNSIDPDDKSFVLSGYRLYDINNLRQNDDKADLLSKYPDLSRRKIYVLRPDTQDYMKEEYETYFADAGYTYDEYLDDIARYPSSAEKETPAFNIVINYKLDGKSLVVNVPFDEIAYRPSYPITKLDILPYMGAGGVNDEGYLFVPDGTGALIYFNNGRQNQLAYDNVLYGWDEAMFRDAVINDNIAPYPVFGIQKNGRALVCVIEEGSAYANIHADVSGRNSSWNNVFPYFTMIHGEKMDISSRSERAVYLYVNGLPQGENITLRYTVCAESGYVGMAKEYRSWLADKFPSFKRITEGGVPIAVEIPGAVNKTQHRLGIPMDLPLKLTTYKEADEMISDFAGFNWENVDVKLNGWFNRSVDHSVPSKIKLVSELGSKKDFLNLMASAEKNNFKVYPEADFMYIKDVKLFDGFSLYRDAARYVNRKRIEKYPFSFVWFGERIRWGKLSYIARPVYMMSLIDNFIKKSTSLKISNIAFRNIASKLSGDYNERRLVSREASMLMRQEKLAQLSESGTGIMLNAGYSYGAPLADVIVDLNLYDQSFGITDVSVPFYPIVLHGFVRYTGKAINLAEDYSLNLLKIVESGAGLYFSFMTEETSELQETKFRQFYANEYSRWGGDADALYKKFVKDFDGLFNQEITDHVILADGVTMTVYENGTRVVVNINDLPWNYNGVTVGAYNYIVIK